MRLLYFDDFRLGVLNGDTVVDVAFGPVAEQHLDGDFGGLELSEHPWFIATYQSCCHRAPSLDRETHAPRPK